MAVIGSTTKLINAGPTMQKRADRDDAEPRVDDMELEPVVQERRKIAADDAAEIGAEERQPGEQRELLDVHAAHA